MNNQFTWNYVENADLKSSVNYPGIAGRLPLYDADGNQTKLQRNTSDEGWVIQYNGENRPVKFTRGTQSIEMKYDYMGRRVEYLSKDGNSVKKYNRFMYKDYTLAQELGSDNSIAYEFVWDPTAGMATKPLIFKLPQRGLALFYTHDGNKNISDLVYWATANGIGAHYEYSPFGETAVSTSNSRVTDVNIKAENPFRFSSEYHDDELGLIYYNYRHYNPTDGKWISRDVLEEAGGYNLYGFIRNKVCNLNDYLGLVDCDNSSDQTIVDGGSACKCRLQSLKDEGTIISYPTSAGEVDYYMSYLSTFVIHIFSGTDDSEVTFFREIYIQIPSGGQPIKDRKCLKKHRCDVVCKCNNTEKKSSYIGFAYGRIVMQRMPSGISKHTCSVSKPPCDQQEAMAFCSLFSGGKTI